MSSTLENRVRRKAGRAGYRVLKSRQRPHFENQGEYMLIDQHALPVFGGYYDATLKDIEAFLDEQNTAVL
jgi:hypothetical protein